MAANGSAVPDQQRPATEAAPPMPGARLALILLISINLFNYIDRQVLAAVLPDIQKEFFPHGGEDVGTKMGALGSAFMVAYMLTAPLFGWLADRMSRWLLIGIGVILWTLASGGSGWAATYLFLFLTRCLVGVGEAAYGPAAPTVISDLYPVNIRGRVLSWFYMAIPVGSALGYVLGGVVAHTTGNWRWAFYMVVPPGLLLGLWAFLMKEPRRGQADTGMETERAQASRKEDALLSPILGEEGLAPLTPSSSSPEYSARGEQQTGRTAQLRDYLILLRTPSYVLNTFGMTAMTFAMGGVGFWMPTYIKSRSTQDLGDINLIFGGMLVVSGLVATLLGGIAGDKLRTRYPGSYFLVSGCSMLLGFPLFLAVLWTPFPWAWIFIFLAIFTLFFNTGPTNTILANVTHPSIRATAFALNIFIIHALGDAISPTVIGYVSDYSSLTQGFLLVSGMILLGGLLWLWGARYLERDTAAAPFRLGD